MHSFADHSWISFVFPFNLHCPGRTSLPVLFLFEVTDGDQPCATSDSELVFWGRRRKAKRIVSLLALNYRMQEEPALTVGWPFHTGGGTVDSEKYQHRLPVAILLLGPHISVTVLKRKTTQTVHEPKSTLYLGRSTEALQPKLSCTYISARHKVVTLRGPVHSADALAVLSRRIIRNDRVSFQSHKIASKITSSKDNGRVVQVLFWFSSSIPFLICTVLHSAPTSSCTQASTHGHEQNDLPHNLLTSLRVASFSHDDPFFLKMRTSFELGARASWVLSPFHAKHEIGSCPTRSSTCGMAVPLFLSIRPFLLSKRSRLYLTLLLPAVDALNMYNNQHAKNWNFCG